MREFKFRVWSIEEKQFISPNILEVFDESGDLTPFKYIKTGKLNPLYIAVENYIIQQYTGLTDKNKNLIYEGDIIINTTSKEEYCSPAVIVWGKYEFVGFALAYKRNKLEDYHAPLIHKINGVDLVEEFSLSKIGIYQIVGNIFENPELLK